MVHDPTCSITTITMPRLVPSLQAIRDSKQTVSMNNVTRGALAMNISSMVRSRVAWDIGPTRRDTMVLSGWHPPVSREVITSLEDNTWRESSNRYVYSTSFAVVMVIQTIWSIEASVAHVPSLYIAHYLLFSSLSRLSLSLRSSNSVPTWVEPFKYRITLSFQLISSPLKKTRMVIPMEWWGKLQFYRWLLSWFCDGAMCLWRMTSLFLFTPCLYTILTPACIHHCLSSTSYFPTVTWCPRLPLVRCTKMTIETIGPLSSTVTTLRVLLSMSVPIIGSIPTHGNR